MRITDKEMCSGCTACYSICPEKCIDMKADEEGFLYPVIDKDRCVNCHACEEVCPVLNRVNTGDFVRKTYALRSRNKNNLFHSTSGGFFLPLATWILQSGGVICAAGYKKDYTVEHMIIDSRNFDVINKEILYRCRGSKYVQSTLNDVFRRLKQLLLENRLVCFIGTPCQVSGLKGFLKQDCRKLITVDFVCHGVPSPMLWKKYILYQKRKYRADIDAISFRSKIFGYHSGGMMKIDFKNGKQYCASARVDYMLRSFFKGVALRPICYHCPFKACNRCSDLTIYDCWHFNELTGQRNDDDKGYTNVIVQSRSGQNLLDSLKNTLTMYPVDTEQAITLDGIMVRNCAQKHSGREKFYQDLDSHSLSEHINRYIPVTQRDYLLELLKQYLYRHGILQIVRNRSKAFEDTFLK